MKIAYLGQFRKFYATERYVEHALRAERVEVARIPFEGPVSYSHLTRKLEQLQSDILLFSKPEAPCYADLIAWCRSQNILTVTWVWDLFFGFRGNRPKQFGADLLFSSDGGHDEEWKEFRESKGLPARVTLRQGIYEPDRVFIDNPEHKYDHDFVFIGTPATYKGRRTLLKRVRKLAKQLGVRYSEFTDVRGLELNELLSKSRVVIGDSYPSPHYWSNRVYEILGRGGFMLFPETEGLEAEFTNDHYVEYPREWEAIESLARHWVRPEQDEQREHVRRAAFERCGAFTYGVRVRALLARIAEHQASRKSP